MQTVSQLGMRRHRRSITAAVSSSAISGRSWTTQRPVMAIHPARRDARGLHRRIHRLPARQDLPAEGGDDGDRDDDDEAEDQGVLDDLAALLVPRESQGGAREPD